MPPKKIQIKSREPDLLGTLKDGNGLSLLEATKLFLDSDTFRSIEAKAKKDELTFLNRKVGIKGNAELRNYVSGIGRLTEKYGSETEKSKTKSFLDAFGLSVEDTGNGCIVYYEEEVHKTVHVDPVVQGAPPPAQGQGPAQDTEARLAQLLAELEKKNKENLELLQKVQELDELTEAQHEFLKLNADKLQPTPPAPPAQVKTELDDPKDVNEAQAVVSALGGKRKLHIDVVSSDSDDHASAPVSPTQQRPATPVQQPSRPLPAGVVPLAQPSTAPAKQPLPPPVIPSAPAPGTTTSTSVVIPSTIVAGVSPTPPGPAIGAPAPTPPPPTVPDVHDITMRKDLKKISKMKLMDVHECKLPMSIKEEVKLLRGGNHLYPIDLSQPKCNPKYYKGLFY